MKSVTKLKDDARKHEQKEEWDNAIQAYLLVLKVGEEGEGELDLPLYNRVGDLYLRLSQPLDAVKYYVQAADRYSDAGLFNNAIALCNKALRHVPQQLDLLRKLGQFSASQGFLTDARRYFLEYAEKKFAAGDVDEALNSLEEFAEVSGDPDVREMLARQLHTHERTADAVEELKKAHAVRLKNGDRAGADALVAEIESLAPGTMSGTAPTAPSPYIPAPAPDEAGYDLEIALPDEPEEEALEGFESTHMDSPAAEDAGDFQVQGFETTHADAEVEDAGGFQLDDFETTAHEDAVVASDDLGLEATSFEPPADIEATALSDIEFDDTSFGGMDEEHDDAHEDSDSAFDLPLLSDDDDTGHVELDSGDGFELPMLGDDENDAAPETIAASDDESSSFDLGGFALPTLTSDTPVDDEAEDTSVVTNAMEDDDEPLHDFGEFGSGPIGVTTEPVEEPAPADADPDEAFISDLIASAPPEHTKAPAPTSDRNKTTSDDATTSGGGWDPSDLGPAPPAPPAKDTTSKPKGKAKDGSDYIDLGSFLTDDDDDEDTTRFRVQEKAPTGDEDHDFAELLSQFKQKVSENVSAEDSAAHYDLGLAFKEMGLVDEAIGEFQIAMRAGDMRLRVYEELGQCFLIKEQFNIAEKVLTRALTMQTGDDLAMIGVYYHLGRAYEGLGNRDLARDSYERVLGLDINFQDVATRLKRL